MKQRFVVAATALAVLVLEGHPALANTFVGADEGKLPLTAGFSDLEGSGGGGLVPLAFISGYGTSDSWGANAHYTNIQLQDFRLQAYGVTAGLFDRAELSYTRQRFDVMGTPLEGLEVNQDVFGLKVKLFGNAVYLQDSWLPQLAAGVEYKHNEGIQNAASVGLAGVNNPTQLGAVAEHGADYYLAASKILLAESVVVNVVLRETRANQFGLLGFGGDRRRGYSLRPEGTVAYLLTRKLALGAEIRSGPRNLSIDDQTNAWTVFGAWAPTRNISVVAAYLNVGSILGPVTGVTRKQYGPYVSVQLGF
jgi:hypothetical protein